jgi:hypothetical protein
VSDTWPAGIDVDISRLSNMLSLSVSLYGSFAPLLCLRSLRILDVAYTESSGDDYLNLSGLRGLVEVGFYFFFFGRVGRRGLTE